MAGRAGGVPESPGGLPGDGTEAAFVARFERRARVHSFLSGLVFLLIAALVGFAGYVFFRAASITLSDFKRDPSVVKLDRESIDMLKGSVEAQRTLRDLYLQQFEIGQRYLIDLIPVDIELSTIRRRLLLAQLREAAGRPLGTDLDRPDPRSKEELQVAIELLQAQQENLESYYASVKQMEAQGAGSQADVQLASTWLEKTRLELNLIKSQEKQIGDGQDGSLSVMDYDLTGYAPLVQTSVTRFGTMIVIFFFISILVPLYRYNVRLTVFYHSIADALLLHQQHPDLSLAELAPVLLPGWGFDAPPETPTQHTAQFLERVAGAAAKRG